MTALDTQIAEFCGLGRVIDPAGSEDAVAAEMANVLLASALVGASLEKVNRLNKLLRILRTVAKLVTDARNREAWVANSFWSYKKMAKYVDHALTPTVQKWVEAGAKLAAEQEPERGDSPTAVEPQPLPPGVVLV